MLLRIPDVLNTAELAEARRLLAAADLPWDDGRASAGTQAAAVKRNRQLPHDDATARTLRALVLRALDRHPTVFAAALPRKVFTPRFNRYAGDANAYGAHVDNAIRFAPDTGQRVRTDISATLFLSEPADYDGGELLLDEPDGTHGSVKLPAGHLLLYPGTRVHQVAPVTRGERLACFFWIESMVRRDDQRRVLFELDQALQQLRAEHGESGATVALTGTYHNLLRMWADA